MVTRTSIKQYQKNSVTDIQDADPHKLISIVYQHILGNLAAAKGAIQREDIESKGNSINKAIALIGELIDSLDLEAGGEVANNLAGLYEFSVRSLIEAHINNDIEVINKLSEIFTDIKSGWDSIPEDQRRKPAPNNPL